jgi:peptide deformylase
VEQAMIYPIVKYGDPVLETPAAPVTEFDEKLQKLIEDMFESMYEAQGVGLAAPQIGISLHLSVIDTSFNEDPEARLVLANPQILRVEGKQDGAEGCLSLPDFREKLARGKRVTIRAQDAHGNWYEKTGEDLLARAFQHEIDHLNGKLYIHHLSSLKRDMMKRKIKRLIRQGEW